jgi:ankyrin repeat protein
MNDIVVAIRDAVRSGDVQQVRDMFAKHPEMVRHEYGGGTWLHIAAHRDSVKMIEMLISHGCNVNAEKEFRTRDTPLDYAIMEDNPETVRILLEHGASLNHGREVIGALTGTKLNCLAVVKLLEQYGADLHRVFNNEMTGRPMNALSEAIVWGKQDVVDYLRSKGAVLPE